MSALPALQRQAKGGQAEAEWAEIGVAALFSKYATHREGGAF